MTNEPQRTSDRPDKDATPTASPSSSGSIGGRPLAEALSSGLARVVADQDHLNKINVYPVPDGDTGTNLALTMSVMAAALGKSDDDHVGRLLERVADAALDGARGNSGAILAQFFLGLADAAQDEASLDGAGLAHAFARGSTYAREALADPVEGTIITVIADVSETLSAAVGRQPDASVAELMDIGLTRARQSLANTPNLLDALRKAGVVDAGAEGFVELIRGMRDSLVDGRHLPLPGNLKALAEDAFDAAAGETQSMVYRYCTECMITGDQVDRRKLKERLATLGDSLVVAGTHRKVKVHVHTNEPDRVFSLGEEFGTVTGEKADDMHRQQDASHSARGTVAVITDTAADIPDEVVEALDIHYTPVRIHFGEHSYLDKVTISADQFYELLRTHPVHPTTSQPAPGDFRRHYQFLASHFPDVVSIHVTASASGTWQAALSAAQRAVPDGRVHVLDSRNASLGQGLIVIHAAECAAAGLDGAAVVERVEAIRQRTYAFGLLRNLAFSVRGGRVSAGVKRVADLLRMTPVLVNKPGGQLKVGGALFGRRNLVDRFADLVVRRMDADKTWRIAVGHADCEADARRLEARLRERVPNVESVYFTRVGTALGVHAGPDGLVVAVQEYCAPQ